MTTVLWWHKEGDGGLQRWRDRVGHQEAERIASEAREVGTAMHSAIEQFLLGWPMQAINERCRLLLRAMLPGLAQIDRVRHLEVPLYSDELRLAGRCDCIADFDGVLSIIDFKNALRPKRKEWIEDYLLQVSAYARMYEERTGVQVTQGVILIATPNDGLQPFLTDTTTMLPKLRSILGQFHAEFAHAA
ncbi:MAG: PD-(D/E)XK nuclease family protein [Bryobacterales bacterium]|nr:PD-(D/E)XK nuclease family protein [Bryobacterales bacterium]